MSHFPSTHLVTTFDAKKSAPLSGQRLAKIRYKTTAKQTAKHPSVCVSVPFLDTADITEHMQSLVPHIRTMLENAQDGVIRSLYEASEANLSSVQDTDISIAACIGYLEAVDAGTRLTKEFLESWFDAGMAEVVTALVVEKLKYVGELTPEQEMKVSQVTKGWKDIISSLAGGKTVLAPHIITNLLGVLELVDTDDTAEKLTKKLVAMRDKPKMEDVLELF